MIIVAKATEERGLKVGISLPTNQIVAGRGNNSAFYLFIFLNVSSKRGSRKLSG